MSVASPSRGVPRRPRVSPHLASDIGTGSLGSLDRSLTHLRTKLGSRLQSDQAEKALSLTNNRGQSLPSLLHEGSSAGNSPRVDTDKALLRGFAARTDSMNASVGRTNTLLNRHMQHSHDRGQSHWKHLRGAVKFNAILHRSHMLAAGTPSAHPVPAAEFEADLENFEQTLEDSLRSVRMEQYMDALRAQSEAQDPAVLKRQASQKLRRRRTEQLESVGTDPKSRAQARIEDRRERNQEALLEGRVLQDDPIPMEPHRIQRAKRVERLELVNVHQLQSQCLGLNASGNSRYDSVCMIAREQEKRKRWETEALGNHTTDHVRKNRQVESVMCRTPMSMAYNCAGHKQYMDLKQRDVQQRRRQAHDLKYARRLLNLRSANLPEDEAKASEIEDILGEIAAAAEEERARQEKAAAQEVLRRIAAEEARLLRAKEAEANEEDEDDDDDDDD